MQTIENNKHVLVTGGSGYLGTACIIALLKKGYQVRTTVRSSAKQQLVLDSLAEAGISPADQLSFTYASLETDDNWAEAMKDCTYVLHLASPFPASEPEDENELILPAREGSLRVLRAASDAGVKRVVLTSSFAAVGLSTDPKGHLFTEEDWTDLQGPQRGYIRSKVLAEQAAWNFINARPGKMELSVINPVAIFGPILSGNYSAAIGHVLQGIIEGHVSQTPPFTLNVVDVRDAAAMHILAMENPSAAGQRFLAGTADAMSFYDIAELIRKKRPQLAGKIADLEPISSDLYIHLTSEKAQKLLGWEPRPREESLLAAIDGLYPASL